MLRSLPTSSEERRGLSLADAKVQLRDFGGAQRFDGYGAVFNSRTAIGNPLTWGFYEQLAEGTFTKTLTEGDARKLIDHDSYYVVSRVSAGTLSLRQDSYGLAVDSALDEELSYVRDLKANLRNGNITGMSFGFRVIKDDWDLETVSTSDGNSAEVEVRTIQEVQLFEVSSVTFPAYEETTAGLRHSLVPALLRRGDQAAIARAAKYRPELAHLLGYDADRASVTIDLKPAGEILGTDVTITAVDGALVPVEESDIEPVDTTRDADELPDDTNTEPAASTPVAPTQAELVAARMRFIASQLR